VVLFSSLVFGYCPLMTPADVALLRRYEHLRDVEINLSDALGAMLTDVALNFAARTLGVPERGEALYETEDSAVCFEFATYHHRVRGRTVIERMLATRKPAAGSDTHVVLTAMMRSQVSLFRLGEAVPEVGVQVEDLLFGHHRFLTDVQLSKRKTQDERFIVSRLLVFDDFSMTPCTSWRDFDPELARMLAAGLVAELPVPMAERFASAEKTTQLAADLVEMALCSVESVNEGLIERFGVHVTQRAAFTETFAASAKPLVFTPPRTVTARRGRSR
jgi:hypothetical protein